MAIKVKKIKPTSSNAAKLSNRSDEKGFSDIIVFPRDTGGGIEGNFIRVTNLEVGPRAVGHSNDLASLDGALNFMLKFYVDSEQAIQANARQLKVSIYNRDPRRKIYNQIASDISSTEFYNSLYKKVSSSGLAIGKDSAGTVVRNNTNIQPVDQLNRKAIVPDGVSIPEPGLVRDVTIPLGIGNQDIYRYNQWRDDLMSQVSPTRRTSPPLPKQRWAELKAPKVDVAVPMVVAAAKPVDNRRNNRAPEALKVATRVTTVNSLAKVANRKNALLGGEDPGQVYNMYYSSGPTFDLSANSTPTSFRANDDSNNETNSYTLDQFSLSNRASTVINDAKSSIQKVSNNKISKNGALQELYRGEYELANRALVASPAASNFQVKEIEFESSLLEQKAEFKVNLRDLPASTGRLYIKLEILGKDTQPLARKIIDYSLRGQIEPHITPSVPPEISITDYREGSCRIELKQVDRLAVRSEVWRMVADIDKLDAASWSKVADVSHTSSQPVTVVLDNSLQGNVDPKIVVYEARCFGFQNIPCSAVSTKVMKGVKKYKTLTKQGECSIVATQVGDAIEVTVQNIPSGVAGLLVKKQTLGTSTTSRSSRHHPSLKQKGAGTKYVPIARGTSSPVTFIDYAVVDRQTYRYYAQFDYYDKGRVNSISDTITKFVRHPKKNINVYMSNVNVDTNSASPSVSFTYSAELTDKGIEQINVALGQTGVSSIFTEELRKDRNNVANLLAVSVTRENKSTGERITWPETLKSSGEFIDSAERNRELGAGIAPPSPNTDYVYTMRVHMLNPETFFTEALTKIPAATRQLIDNASPNFVQVSSRKFAENFGIEPGVMPSPWTINQVDVRNEVLSAYTGIERNTLVNIPDSQPTVTEVSASKIFTGVPCNLVKWKIDGDASKIYEFRLAVNIANEESFPLAKLSPRSAGDGLGEYRFKDVLFANEIVPVTYTVSIVYNTQEESSRISTDAIYNGSIRPTNILDKALKLQSKYVPAYPYDDLLGGLSAPQRISEDIRSTNPLLGNSRRNRS